ncbi:hypothetical protein PVAND_015643 [Polypedilum vanderplanki]|uniref:F-box domain-containing protein n=1 Tax=Polypedilum vanderplanki TaxID=319348 RepID=A0A9J6BDH1_POLVA|nr:hypothetical protein PVAND_015643 [Polypedilum vanderplanki]
MEVSFNILDFPNEILMKIVKFAQNDKNLSQTCKKFYELISKLNEKNVSLCVDYRYLINPAFDIDKFLKSSASISLTIDKHFSSIKNYNEKLEDFMKIYGYKIKNLIIACEISNFTTKLLPLLTNLETLEFHHEEVAFDDSEIQELSVKLRKLKISCIFDLTKLHIFDFEELDINLDYFNQKKNVEILFQKHKNIKKLKVVHNRNFFDFENLLKHLKLESLTIVPFNNQCISNFIRFQRNLKDLIIYSASRKTFNIICENLNDLEKLKIDIFENLYTNDLHKFSSLKKLKVLSIDQSLNSDEFFEFSKNEFENLEELTLSLHMEFSENSFDNFLQNHSKLKSLDLTILELKCLKVITEIIKIFNNLEKLNLNFIEEFVFIQSEIEEFYRQNDKNENLKTLIFRGSKFNINKLILKFIYDFPNLETLNIRGASWSKLNENFMLILKGFPKLKIIENLVITEEIFDTFLIYGKNLEKFQIDINMLENPNEILKDCSIALKGWKTLASITRENEKNFDLSMMIYNNWKKIKTLMDSTKQIKILEIFSLRNHKFCDKIISDEIKNCLQNVTNLTIQKNFSSLQLEAFLKAVPNLEILTFDNMSFLKNSENILQIENERIQSICAILDSRLENEFLELNELLTNIRFSVKSFKILLKNVENFEDQNINEKIENLIIDKQNVTKKIANWNEETKEYSYESVFKIL